MSRKTKIAESVSGHRNVDVRLASQYLLQALEFAKTGQVQEMLTAIRIAENFGSLVNPFDENVSKEIA